MAKPKHRMTKQRKLILEVLRSTDSHPTADWIYEQVKKEIPNISLGTVYRNLRLLSEMNKISVLDFGSSYSRFDGNPHNHYHFICNNCEQIFDIEMPFNERLNEKINNETPFLVENHRIDFTGLCPECQNKN
ncbi:MAG TPA: transcriptional repressor [Halanaerobiaceae bacterium]|jgi:Fur family peroxide stress response transcriptional regulator|nr:transcriptional repressor [Halanaerobiaceae bacterium]